LADDAVQDPPRLLSGALVKLRKGDTFPVAGGECEGTQGVGHSGEVVRHVPEGVGEGRHGKRWLPRARQLIRLSSNTFGRVRDLDDALVGLDAVEALRVLISAWRRSAHPLLTQAIDERSRAFARALDWDLHRFDVTTLPQVLAWLVDSGPTSPMLATVLTRLEPYLPDPRATAPLEALVSKKTTQTPKVLELLELHRRTSSNLSADEALAVVKSSVVANLEREAKLASLLVEPSMDQRAVLADWLTDHAEPIGEFVGLQLARPVDAAPSSREQALWGQHGIAWIRFFLGGEVGFNAPMARERVRFERGVPVGVVLDYPPAKRPAGWGHVQHLEVRTSYLAGNEHTTERMAPLVPDLVSLVTTFGHVQELAAHGPFPTLERLVLRQVAGAWGSNFAVLSTFSGLKVLRLERNSLSDRGLATALKAVRQRSLDLELWLPDAKVKLSFPEGRAKVSAGDLGASKKVRASWDKLLAAIRSQVSHPIQIDSPNPLPPELATYFG
jgi:hypothetical protein